MAIQQVSQLVSSFELLVEPISPVPIPSTSAGGSVLASGNGGSNGGTATAVAPSAVEVSTSAGALSRIVRQIASNVGATIVTPIAIQGYFMWITNLGTDPLTPVVTVSADPTATATLTTVTNPKDPLTASVLAITSVGNRKIGIDGNIFSYLQLVNGVPTITLPTAIPVGGTALFTLVGNYGIIPDLTKANLEVRGSLSIAIDPGSSAQFAQVLLEPQTRTTFVTAGVPAPAETAFALPTARGNARYTLPGPAFYIKSLLNGFAIDASGPVKPFRGDPQTQTQLVINPVNGSPTQLWYVTSDGYIVNVATGYVMDLQGGLTSDGTPVIIYPRNNPATTNQKWTLTDGQIQSQLGNYVLDVTGGQTAPGTPLQIHTPNSGNNQKWFLLPTLA